MVAGSEQCFVEKGQIDNTALAMLLNRMQCGSAKASKLICVIGRRLSIILTTRGTRTSTMATRTTTIRTTQTMCVQSGILQQNY